MPELAGGILPVIEFFCGAAAGVALGRWVRNFSWGWAADGLIGGVGGLLFVWPSPRIPGVGRFIGNLANGLTPAMLAGAAIARLLGGLILVLLAGFLKVLIHG